MIDNFIQYLDELTGIGVAFVAMILMWRMNTNHIKHMTDAIYKLKDAIEALKDMIQKNGR